MAAKLRLQGEEAGELGPGKLEGMGANRMMSHIAGEEADLTEATSATETQRRPQNGRWTTASFTAHAE
jgi:hypothetical protein